MREWAAAAAAGPADPVLVQEIFFEARFGFRQALGQWPDNQAAKAGLEACLTRKFDFDLARDDFESAAVVAKELSPWSGCQMSQTLLAFVLLLRVYGDIRMLEMGVC